MRVLVTGGAGYIGSHTCQALIAAGHEPVILDSLVKGHLWAAGDVPFVQADIADEAAVRELCAQYQPEALIHFAAFSEVAQSVREPELYRDNNVRKAGVLFDTVRDCGIERIVFSSTAAVYGKPDKQAPIPESAPLEPVNPYGESKLLAEQKLRFLEPSGVRSVALRYFNAAGAVAPLGEAHAPETHLIPNVLRAVLGLSGPVSLFGTDYPTPDGTAVRDYVHVADLAAAHLAALDYLGRGGASVALNLGSGRGASVREVIEAASRLAGRAVPVEPHARRAGDPPFLIADAARARALLNWRPEKTLEEIIASALVWHQSERYRSFLDEQEAAR